MGLSELTTGERNSVLLIWPWYATLAVAILALVLGRLGRTLPERSA